MAQNLGSVFATLELRSAGFIKGLDQAETKLGSFDKKLQGMGSSLDK